GVSFRGKVTRTLHRARSRPVRHRLRPRGHRPGRSRGRRRRHLRPTPRSRPGPARGHRGSVGTGGAGGRPDRDVATVTDLEATVSIGPVSRWTDEQTRQLRQLTEAVYPPEGSGAWDGDSLAWS